MSNAPYNLWIKLFASKYTERAFVLSYIVRHNRKKLKRGLGVVFLKIVKFWNILGETSMKRLQKIVYGPEDLTDEDIATFFSLFNIKPEMAINYFGILHLPVHTFSRIKCHLESRAAVRLRTKKGQSFVSFLCDKN